MGAFSIITCKSGVGVVYSNYKLLLSPISPHIDLSRQAILILICCKMFALALSVDKRGVFFMFWAQLGVI